MADSFQPMPILPEPDDFRKEISMTYAEKPPVK
jgi:hypothetical protein